ncbi:pseudouridine synthase [Oceanospirillum linum]|uniref:Pseudouridine synthase n=1 Tax=Oceanospirillum linum TaxID=966 RepID=A0A1T1HCI9_OCELI|nr:pseudouridine synthase [Oceanospirillum linum]OOV87532.1 16S rRNA pseudouridine(516) synthase [Oceanospirillum linum]SEF90901.1 16S rRNA pseudouridine516 synthase [Oleiphilus messinensis]SMP13257.1 16S rRNA pseudouridine516 synthase [Oceanospirillum linum]
MRLDKFVCKSTALTRAEAISQIQQGRVSVNGAVEVSERTQVHENNRITLVGAQLTPRPFRYMLLHKPANTVCSNVDEAYPSLFNGSGIPDTEALHVAGRLDADTTGLVLITDDGRWSFEIIRPDRLCEKVYRVGLSRPIHAGVAERFATGLLLQGEAKPTQPAKLEIVNPREVLLTITEGRYHQVKRMFAAVGNRVRSLHRAQIGAVRLDVSEGQWRYLTPDEVRSFGDQDTATGAAAVTPA